MTMSEVEKEHSHNSHVMMKAKAKAITYLSHSSRSGQSKRNHMTITDVIVVEA